MLRMMFVIVLIIAGAIFSAVSAFNGLLFYLWNAYFRPESWVYGGFILSLRLSLIIGAYVVIRTLLSGFRPKISAGTLLLFAFLAQCVLGVVTSEHRDFSWTFFQDFVKVIIMTYLIVVLVNTRDQFRLVLLVIALSLGFETAKQGWAGLFLAPGAKNQNQSPFLGDNNGVAMGTMMLLPIIGALVQTSEGALQRWLHRFFGIGVFMRGITTYSRGGFLGAGALGAIHIWRSERKVRAVIPIVALAGLVWTVMPSAYWERIDTIDAEAEERDSSAESRLHFWQVGVAMAEANPMTGVGLNAYNSSFAMYNTDEKYASQERSAHSTWFGVLGDLGYPGLVLFLGNVVVAFWSCWSVARVAGKRPELRALKLYANALISALVVFCVCGTFLSSHYNEMVWHLIGLSTALYWVCRQETNPPSQVPVRA